jgi:LemA protein
VSDVSRLAPQESAKKVAARAAAIPTGHRGGALDFGRDLANAAPLPFARRAPNAAENTSKDLATGSRGRNAAQARFPEEHPMKKFAVPIIAFVLVLLAANWGCGGYNSLVSLDEKVNAAWAQVQNVYQRRSDLIPNLVATVQGAADFERGTLTDVIEARSKATRITVDESILNDPAKFEQFQAAQGELSGALARPLVAVEAYPTLKANENFLALQSQLEGSENRIAVERRNFNEAAQGYNAVIRRLPTALIARLGGFERKAYFEAEPAAQKAPEVKFER